MKKKSLWIRLRQRIRSNKLIKINEQFIIEYNKYKKERSLWYKIKKNTIYRIVNQVPICGSYTDKWNGDHDCKYYPEFECELCVCVDYRNGLDPRTGEKFKKLKCGLI
jgi:DNA modification methylase